MKILVANDDGYQAAGLHALADVCRTFGEVAVVAPEQNSSGTSNALTLHRPLSVFDAPGGVRYINGTPSDCVHVAMTGLLDWRPDLVVSGINNGANLGEDTLYSGTVAAAMEGFLFGVPAIAFSLTRRGWPHLDQAARVAEQVIRQVLDEGRLETAWLLNVNIPPHEAAATRPWRVTRLGRRHASEPVIRQANPRGEPIYWIGAVGDAPVAGEGTDFHAIAEGCVSITPLQVDLTDHAGLAGWQQRLIGAAPVQG